MKFDDEKEDYFDEVERPETPPAPPRVHYSPEDPRYWEEEESEFEHLIPSNSGGRKMTLIWGAVALIVVAIVGIIYFHWFRPYADQSMMSGYINNIERRGLLFKTYEGELIPFRSVIDTTRMDTLNVDRSNYTFSAVPEVAAKLRRMQYSNTPVRVEVKRYRASLPWRGESRVQIVAVDSLNPADLIPINLR